MIDVRDLYNGCVVWEGKSLLVPNQEIGLILTGLERPSHNTKTGAVIQSHILVKNIPPKQASMQGLDSAICGDCPLKRKVCYVDLGKSVYQIWHAWQRGIYPPLNQSMLYAMQQREKVLRMDSYGEHTAVPLSVWEPIFPYVKGILGYTHQWHRPEFQNWRKYSMASVETITQAMHVKDMGWRYYRIASAEDDMLLPNEILCKNFEDMFTTCEFCGLCNGMLFPHAKDIVVPIHGLSFKKRNFQKIKEQIIMQLGEQFQVYLELPVEEGRRPEKVRVIDHPGCTKYFLVQVYREERKIWITRKEWTTLESAILDALLCYPLPESTYSHGFNLYRDSMKGNIQFIAYQHHVDNAREWQESLTIKSNHFEEVKSMIKSIPNSRIDDEARDRIAIIFTKNDAEFYLRAKFIPDYEILHQQPVEDVPGSLQELLSQMHLYLKGDDVLGLLELED